MSYCHNMVEDDEDICLACDKLVTDAMIESMEG